MSPRLIPIARNSKVAAIEWTEYQTRAPTPDEMHRWHTQFPGCNWGLLTGVSSGVVVLDVDVRHHGMDALRDKNLPVTRAVLTWSGGWHYYFRCPNGGCRTVPKILPGCDLKGDGGYVLVPPSTIDGNPYETAMDTEPAPLPDWLVQHLRRKGSPVGMWRRALGPVPQGEQDCHLIALAGKLARSMDEEIWYTIPSLLATVAAGYPQDPRRPWTMADFQRIADSACRMEHHRRLSVALRTVTL